MRGGGGDTVGIFFVKGIMASGYAKDDTETWFKPNIVAAGYEQRYEQSLLLLKCRRSHALLIHRMQIVY
eukprot:COSAG02_NODE_69_length_42323_cov_23.507850_48_plen_69_part_00